MGVDSYFAIGSAHALAAEPCQDYATHENSASGCYGVVADGCSNSAGRPDIGARLVAMAMLRAMQQGAVEEIERRLLASLRATLSQGYASHADLLTTVGGFVERNGEVDAWLWGDGVLYAEYPDGSKVLKVVQWDGNIPLYPVYLLEGHPGLTGMIESDDGETQALSGGLHWKAAKPRKFLIATDGMLQLDHTRVVEAVSQLTAYKTLAGSFLKRRALRALKGMPPADDIAVAAYHEADR